MIYEDSRYENSDVERMVAADGSARLTIIPTPQTVTAPYQFSYYTVKLGDRIDILAQTFLGDAELWWVIANANPQWSFYDRLPPGIVLRIPSGIGTS